MDFRHSLTAGVLLAAAIPNLSVAQNVGPSTTTEPYVLPTAPGVVTTSILTVGDAVGGYRMVGLPDGIGVPSEAPGTLYPQTFDLVLNHEISKNLGVTRAHGSNGAFVSRWSFDRSLKVLSGRDHLTNPNNVFAWRGSGWAPGTIAFDRLCSADLPAKSAFYFDNAIGTQSRMFLSGEETTPPFSADHGRVFAHVVSGPDMNKTYELPRLGKMAFENALASPFRQNKTVVMLSDDANRDTDVTLGNVCRTQGQTGCKEPPSELFMYVGVKQGGGSDVQRAGLANGRFFGLRVRVNGVAVAGENKDFVFSGSAPAITSARFEAVNFGDVSNRTGVQIQDRALASSVTQFMRIEDGAWDPRPGKERDYYFVTTGRLHANADSWHPSRLWRLRFDDIRRPELGGEITMLLTNQFYPGADSTPDSDPAYQMFDNMTIDHLGRIVLQEDTGRNDRRGRIYVYGIDSGKLVQVAVHNPKFFGGDTSSNPNFLTNDEESSGVIDASQFLGDGWFLLASQSHKGSADPELVEGGQLLALYIPIGIAR